MSAQCLGHLPVQQALIIASNLFPYRFLQDVHETDDLPSYTITDAAGGTCRQGYFARYHVRTVKVSRCCMASYAPKNHGYIWVCRCLNIFNSSRGRQYGNTWHDLRTP